MLLCGNVYIDYETNKFSLKCLTCDSETRLYTEFIKHVREEHKFRNNHGLHEASETMDCLDLKSDHHISDSSHIINQGSDLQDRKQFVNYCTEDGREKAFQEVNHRQINNDDYDSNDHEQDYDHDYDHEEDDQTDDDKEDMNNTDLPTYTEKFVPTFFRKKRFLNDFIDLYRSQHCLWDTNDANYTNEIERQQAEQAIISGMKQFNVFIKNRGHLHRAFERLHKLCANIKYNLENPGQKKIANIAINYYKRCHFLHDLLFNTNTNNTQSTDYKLKKFLNFYQWNQTTVQFIECYSYYPIFYNTQNENHLNISEREKALEELNHRLFTNHIVFKGDELVKAIDLFQLWFYKTKNRLQSKKQSTLTKVEEKYLSKCKFMPDKQAKRQLICSHCQKLFQCITTLKTHQYKIHKIGELPFKCEQCDRSFEQNSALQVHRQRVHVGKIYQCQYCERRFAVKSDLKVHTRIHTAEKPHICEQCGKSFRLRTQLGYHVTAIHTKIRAFKCTICPKDFLKKRDLTDHVKTHFNIRDKICETCGKGFSNSHSLIRHRQIHSDIKKFACKLCDARFKQFVGLNGHMKRTHNIIKRKLAS